MDDPSCRICFNPNNLVTSLCYCKGSIAYVHEACLIKWIKLKDTRNCELCKVTFRIVERKPGIYKILKRLCQYMLQSKTKFILCSLYPLIVYYYVKLFKFSFKWFILDLVQGPQNPIVTTCFKSLNNFERWLRELRIKDDKPFTAMQYIVGYKLVFMTMIAMTHFEILQN
jgi:hypothetical protein